MIKPKCTQCLRAQRDCPGYRPQSNGRFLDQTGEVLAKARVQSNPGQIKQIPRSLTQPVEARALSFFLSSFILGSNFEYLASFYTPYSDREEQFSTSIEAVGLVSLSIELQSLELLERARDRYIDAIRAMNTALRDPVSVRKDSTLLAVLLLSLYSVLACTTGSTMCLWESHIKGAMALIWLRGSQQMQSQLGLNLLKQASAGAAISAHRSKAEVPPEIISLVAHGLHYAHKDDPSWSFRLISIRSANLRAAIKTGSLSDPDSIIAAAVGLDLDFVAWSRTLPPSWQFECHSVEEANSAVVYEGCYHLYSTHWIAQGMNAWRLNRLQLNELIWQQTLRQHSSPLRSRDHAVLMRQVESTITGLCSDICATVPQYVELPAVPPVSVTVCRMQSPIPTTCDTPSHKAKRSKTGFTHSARSYGVIWPMMEVANCVIPNSPRRAWVIDRLGYISRHMKNPQALLALDILEGKLDEKRR